MKQSAYLIQQRETRRRLVQAAERVTQQLMLDTLQVTLHQEFGFGYDRIKRLTDAWSKTYNQFHDALDGGTEADYWQEKLDRLLMDLLRDHQALIPFGERYPEIREITYGPRRAGKGKLMGERYKIDCAKEDDRKLLVTILASNGYTVHLCREKRGTSSAYTHFVEYWKEGKA